jgi:hypothetical protein
MLSVLFRTVLLLHNSVILGFVIAPSFLTNKFLFKYARLFRQALEYFLLLHMEICSGTLALRYICKCVVPLFTLTFAHCYSLLLIAHDTLRRYIKEIQHYSKYNYLFCNKIHCCGFSFSFSFRSPHASLVLSVIRYLTVRHYLHQHVDLHFLIPLSFRNLFALQLFLFIRSVV